MQYGDRFIKIFSPAINRVSPIEDGRGIYRSSSNGDTILMKVYGKQTRE